VCHLPVSIGGRTAAMSDDVSSRGFCLATPLSVSFTVGQTVDGFVLQGDEELHFRGKVGLV